MTMTRTTMAILLVALAAAPAAAQNEDALRSFFEGRTIRLKLEMPGSEEGVDVYPGAPRPVDFPKHLARLKKYGSAYRSGDPALVSRIRLKGDHIEFQLGAGGYGTFGDDVSGDVYVPTAPKTEREKNLEKDLPKTTDPAQRRKIGEELDQLKRERQREDARNRTRAEQARAIKQAEIRQRRIEGGSRFNLRYEKSVPPEGLTPDGVMTALQDYVDFGPMLAPGAPAAAPVGDLHKGMTVDEVDALLGRPESITQRQEGTLTVSTSSYRQPGRHVLAEFVEGVLIRFTITSQ